jgi:polyferredoxin
LRRRIGQAVFTCLLLIFSISLYADGSGLELSMLQDFFPVADHVTQPEGKPPLARVYRGDVLLGYACFTDDIVKIPAYSGKPIHTLLALDVRGTIQGVKIIRHEEPILKVGISEQDLQQFLNQYTGKSALDTMQIGGRSRHGSQVLDAISGATITVMVLNASINRSLQELNKAYSQFGKSDAVKKGSIQKYEPIWVQVWRDRVFRIVVLSLGLLTLLFILVWQDWLARHPRLLRHLRSGFLAFTVIFIGWYSLAQLSIVNVLVFFRSLMHDFSWENFLISPSMFILWSFVALAILLWGRGVYCGWLCPYGALQEFVFRLGNKLRIPSFEFPEIVHERLWAIKYIILLALFAMSLHSMSLMETYAEVEPFKTAITMRFQREWGFVIYALLMLLVSLFNRKFFCRYVCPLGAALTFPSKFRIFDWLRRRKECGHPCQICRNECEVGAIRTTGEIIDSECHYCLDCQVTYWNDQKCPPLVDKRRRRERHRRDDGAVAVKVVPPDPPT